MLLRRKFSGNAPADMRLFVLCANSDLLGYDDSPLASMALFLIVTMSSDFIENIEKN